MDLRKKMLEEQKNTKEDTKQGFRRETAPSQRERGKKKRNTSKIRPVKENKEDPPKEDAQKDQKDVEKKEEDKWSSHSDWHMSYGSFVWNKIDLKFKLEFVFYASNFCPGRKIPR